jgi:disulfide oxidoreductase YuzD
VSANDFQSLDSINYKLKSTNFLHQYIDVEDPYTHSSTQHSQALKKFNYYYYTIIILRLFKQQNQTRTSEGLKILDVN